MWFNMLLTNIVLRLVAQSALSILVSILLTLLLAADQFITYPTLIRSVMITLRSAVL